jgi:hypothetical protein
MPIPVAPVNNPGTHGKLGIVALKLAAADTYIAIGNVSEWALNMTKDKVETTALGDLNKRYVIGMKDMAGTFSAFFDRVSDVIFAAADQDDGCFLAFYPAGDASEQAWEGPAHLDASIKGGITSAVTIDATFVANGNWTRTPVPVIPLARTA